jgi:ankyrin repeat protein
LDIDIQSEPYGTPLNFAARHDRPLVNEFLLDRGANVNKSRSHASQRSSNNCLHWSMDEDRVSFVSVRLVSVLNSSLASLNALPDSPGSLYKPKLLATSSFHDSES